MNEQLDTRLVIETVCLIAMFLGTANAFIVIRGPQLELIFTEVNFRRPVL